jgi:hypothetical protein
MHDTLRACSCVNAQSPAVPSQDSARAHAKLQVHNTVQLRYRSIHLITFYLLVLSSIVITQLISDLHHLIRLLWNGRSVKKRR